MFSSKFWLLLLWLPSIALGQVSLPLTGIGATVASAGGATPVFVSENGINSTTGSAFTLGTNPTGQVFCANLSFCLPTPDPVLSGNLGIIAGRYSHATTNLNPSGTDTNDTFTCASGSSSEPDVNSVAAWPMLCYAANLTAGSHIFKTTWSSAVTEVTQKAAQFYNIATSSPLDGSVQFCAGASSSSPSCSGLSTTVSNDLIYAVFCRVGTPTTPIATVSVTAWSITSNVVTFTATNTLSSGQVVELSSFGTSTFFNGQTVTVLSAGLSGTAFEANFTHANGSGTEAGLALGVAFIAGSGYTLGTTDLNDGCASEFEVASGTGSVTPSMSFNGYASTYVVAVAAFKSATAGTAPTGTYIDRESSWSTPSGSQTIEYMQVPSTGNFLILTGPGGDAAPTAVADGINTWIEPVTPVISANAYTNILYSKSASSNTTGMVKITASNIGSGDWTNKFMSFVNAPTSPAVSTGTYLGNATAASASLPYQFIAGNGGAPDGASAGGFLPIPTSGLAIVNGSQDSNTSTAISTPSSFIFDAAGYGGMPINGPEPIDQNNIYGHYYPSSAGGQGMYVITQSQSSLAVGNWSGVGMGVWNSGFGILHWTENQRTTAGTSLAITVPSTTSGNLLAVGIQIFNSTARTISTVKCNDASTTSFTAFSGATTTGNSTHGATTIYYILSAPSGCTTVTITASASASNLEAQYEEVQRFSGSWATDVGSVTSLGTGSGTTVSAPSLTTTGNPGFCTAVVAVAGSGITAAPLSGNEFVYGGVVWSADNNSAVSLLTTTAGAHQAKWTDGTSADTFNSSAACWK